MLAEEALKAGAEVPFRRPAELASDTAGSWAVVCHAVEMLEKDGYTPDYVVLLQPTTPFRRREHIDALFALMLESGSRSGLTIRPSDYPPQWMFWRSPDGRLTRLFAEGASIRRRQDARVAWQPNGLIYIVERALLSPDLSLPFADSATLPMAWEDSINIDAYWQYQLAEILWPSSAAKGSRHAE